MAKNYCTRETGDKVNLILVAAAFNFRKAHIELLLGHKIYFQLYYSTTKDFKHIYINR